MFVSVQNNLQHIDICTLRMSTSFEYIVDTSDVLVFLSAIMGYQDVLTLKALLITLTEKAE